MIAVPTLHPAFLLRSGEGSEGQAKFFDTVVGDFAKALNLLKRPPNWDEQVIWKRDKLGRLVNLFPTVAEVYEFCRRAQGHLCSIDVETTGEQPLACQLICIGIACENGDAICVPILKQGGEAYWTPGDKERVLECLRWLFADPQTPKVAHNGPFDSVVLWANGLQIFTSWREDTMAAHHVVDAELPHGLAYVASRYLEIPYWKDDVKGDVRWLMLPDETLRSYNLRDGLAALRAHPILQALITEYGLEELYREEMGLAHESARMTIRGLFVDQERKTKLGIDLHLVKEESIGHLCRIAGDENFNPGSPVQLCEQLFEHLKFPIVKRTEKGNPSTDKDAMVLMAFQAKTEDQFAFLKWLVKWKKSTKFLSTWVEGLPILGDGRLHPSWKLLTVTGRYASSPNAQNWNAAVKRMFCAQEGNILVGMDLSQAELRVMAYLANDAELLYCYENDLNVHTINTTLLFEVRNPGVDTSDMTEMYLADSVPRLLGVPYDTLPVLPKSQWKPARTLAKNFVFGDNYGAEATTLFNVIRAKRNPDNDELLFPDITLGEIEAAKITWEKLHPEIPQWWKTTTKATTTGGGYRCPISGRIRWFRGGFKRNEMLNFPIQTLVASHMNKVTLRCAPRIEASLGSWQWGINAQVHDALGAEVPRPHEAIVRQIFKEEASKSFALPGFPNAILPPDEPKAAKYVDEV